jgi:hypothetical protein
MSRHLPLPPREYLEQFLRLDAETGRLFWIKAKNPKHPAGNEAGLSPNGPKGYLTLGWDGKRYLVHRIVYLMFYGTDPKELLVDHINGVTNDNRPENLRLATASQNAKNMHGPMKHSKTGVLGVHWNTQNNAWCAKISVNGGAKSRFFKDFDKAVAASEALRSEHYGEFAGSLT